MWIVAWDVVPRVRLCTPLNRLELISERTRSDIIMPCDVFLAGEDPTPRWLDGMWFPPQHPTTAGASPTPSRSCAGMKSNAPVKPQKQASSTADRRPRSNSEGQLHLHTSSETVGEAFPRPAWLATPGSSGSAPLMGVTSAYHDSRALSSLVSLRDAGAIHWPVPYGLAPPRSSPESPGK